MGTTTACDLGTRVYFDTELTWQDLPLSPGAPLVAVDAFEEPPPWSSTVYVPVAKSLIVAVGPGREVVAEELSGEWTVTETAMVDAPVAVAFLGPAEAPSVFGLSEAGVLLERLGPGDWVPSSLGEGLVLRALAPGGAAAAGEDGALVSLPDGARDPDAANPGLRFEHVSVHGLGTWAVADDGTLYRQSLEGSEWLRGGRPVEALVGATALIEGALYQFDHDGWNNGDDQGWVRMRGAPRPLAALDHTYWLHADGRVGRVWGDEEWRSGLVAPRAISATAIVGDGLMIGVAERGRRHEEQLLSR